MFYLNPGIVKVKLIGYRVFRLNNSANKSLDNFLISFMLNDHMDVYENLVKD